jgi:hypothetical protein
MFKFLKHYVLVFKYLIQQRNKPNINPFIPRDETEDILIFKCNPNKEMEFEKFNANPYNHEDVYIDLECSIITILNHMSPICFYSIVKDRFCNPNLMCYKFPLDFKDNGLYSINNWTIKNIEKLKSASNNFKI